MGRHGFSRSMAGCLSVLSRGDDAGAAWSVLGASDVPKRAALAKQARRLLEFGMEATIESMRKIRPAESLAVGATISAGEYALPAPCCTAEPCVQPEGSGALWSPPLPVAGRSTPRHPNPIAIIDTAVRAAAGSRGGSTSVQLPAFTGLSRPPSAVVAQSAAGLLADGASLLPSTFDARFTNPCWRCNSSSSSASAGPDPALCCLPFAHILGVSKCGTTDLHSRLASHTSILRSANKGPHWWDEPHTLPWYLNLFSSGARALASGSAPTDSIFIDASSNTLSFTGVGVRGERRHRVTIPHVLAWLQPSVRLLLMLREPSARYYSAYWYYDKRYKIYSRFGPTGAASFDAMATADIAVFDRCRASGATARRCARQHFHEAQQLIKGLYSVSLEPWLGVFPPSQMLILRLEDYEANLAAHLRAVLAFLSLSKPPRATWQRMLAQKRANKGAYRHAGGKAMLASTQAKLRTFYAPFNEDLARLVGDQNYLEWHAGGNGSEAASHQAMLTPGSARAGRRRASQHRSVEL